MNLVALLDEGLVKIPLEGLTKDEVIAELAELLVRAGKVKDREGMLDALMAREDKGSTGIGGSVAIPHARSAELQGIVLAVGVSPEGAEFDAVDDQPVHLVFLLMGAASRPELNIEALADIGALVQTPGNYRKLVQAPDARSLIQLLADAQNAGNSYERRDRTAARG